MLSNMNVAVITAAERKIIMQRFHNFFMEMAACTQAYTISQRYTQAFEFRNTLSELKKSEGYVLELQYIPKVRHGT